MTALRMLHVEDEPNARTMIADLLGDQVTLVSVGSAEAALDACQAEPFDLTLLDWTLPGKDGGQFLDAVRDSRRAGRVVVLTAIGTLERAQEAMRAGAYDFLVKPADPDALLELIEKATRSVHLIRSADRSRPTIKPRDADTTTAILGSSAEVSDLKERLHLVASSDAAVLIHGESGTGKELVARSIHESSGRHRGRLITVNCAAIPEALFESELFGHKRGAFTGANADRPGLIELAHQGTLFLDEVGELPPASQAKLLRVLQENQVRRVGESTPRAVDVRVITATNRDLELEVDKGAFREDLLFRLDVIRLDVPPLRDRIGDLPELLTHFLHRHANAYERPAPALTDPQLTALTTYDWPGNIRQLENAAKRIVLLGFETTHAELQRKHRRAPDAPTPLPNTPPTPEDIQPLKDVLRAATRDAILRALQATQGQRTQAAQLLGVSRKTLFNKMQDLGIREESSWS